MTKMVSRCVSCGLPCSNCTWSTPIEITCCDEHEDENAEYHVSEPNFEADMCEDCLDEYCNTKWNNLTSDEKIALFDEAQDVDDAEDFWMQSCLYEKPEILNIDVSPIAW